MESCPFDNLFRSASRLPKAGGRQIGDDLDSGVVWLQSTADRMNHAERCYWERFHDMNEVLQALTGVENAKVAATVTGE